MKHYAGLFVSRAVILLLALCLSVPAALGESDADTYIFCVRDGEGKIVAAMDRSYYLQSSLNWLDLEDAPSGQPCAAAIASMKRDVELSRIGKLSFIPPEYIPEYTGGKQGVYVHLGIGFPIIAMSAEDQAVIVLDEFSRQNADISVAMPQMYSWLGYALYLRDQLGADVPVYQISSTEDEGYVFDVNECLAYTILYAYLGGDKLWTGNIGMEADQETFVRWFLAQSTTRRLILADDPGIDASVYEAYMPDGDSVLIVTDTASEKDFILVKSEDDTFVLSISGGFAEDPISEEMVIEGYVHAIFLLNGCQPGDYSVNALIIDDGSLLLTSANSDRENIDRLINTWIQFAVENEQSVLRGSVQ